ncbi:MAG: transposase [Eubacteriaceae bacterium]|nr:transposase [Eubacteriaceae bacterium]
MRKAMPLLDTMRLFFLDETNINAAMTKEYGWGVGRVAEYTPDPRGTGQTLVAAVGLSGIVAPLLFKGAMSAAIFFYQYLQELLIPSLQKGSILILDNLSSHMPVEAEALLLRNKVAPLHLPPYSPDMNAIEFVWQVVKDSVKRIKPRDIASVIDAVGIALGSVTPECIKSLFLHCGYSRSIT